MTVTPKRKARPKIAESAEERERDGLAALLNEFGAIGYQVKLYRQSDAPPRVWLYLNKLEMSPELVEDVQSQYGGGSYRALVYDGQKYVKGGTILFAIAGKPRLDDDAAGGGDRLARLERQLERIAEPKTNSVEQGVTLITGIIAALTPLVAPLLTLLKPRENGGSVVETLQLVSDAEARGEARGRTIGTLEADKGGASLGDVANQYLPAIVSVLDNNRKQRALPAGAAPATPEAAPAAAVTPAPFPVPTTTPEPEYLWMQELRPFHPRLMQQARADTDPAIVADFALAQMPDELLAAIATAAARSDFTTILTTELVTIGQQYPAWVENFVFRVWQVSQPEPAAAAPKARTKR